jgi:protein-disulfide isomerase
MSETETKKGLSVPVAIVLAGVLVAGAVFITNGKGTSNTANVDKAIEEATAKKDISPVTDQDHIKGNPDAEILIVEYSDTECPYCKNFHNTMNQIMDEYGKTGKVAWVYRHFPLDNIHSKARKEAEAAECAAEIGGKDAFWDYMDKIFEVTPSNNKLDLALLPTIAKELELDETLFNTCLESGKYANKVEADFQSGVSAGVEGTPYSLIIVKNSDTVVPINGAQPYSVVSSVIDSILK